jgi:hypothetical protein
MRNLFWFVVAVGRDNGYSMYDRICNELVNKLKKLIKCLQEQRIVIVQTVVIKSWRAWKETL